jgi:hypothetical protein
MKSQNTPVFLSRGPELRPRPVCNKKWSEVAYCIFSSIAEGAKNEGAPSVLHQMCDFRGPTGGTMSPVEQHTFGYISKCNTSENVTGHNIFSLSP